MSTPFTLKEILEGKESIGIAGHVRPDGDCIGSSMGMYNYIKTNFPEKDVHVFLEPIPNLYKFIANTDKLEDASKEDRVFDLFIALDCGDERRLGAAGKLFAKAEHTACIDHHESNDSFAEYDYIVPTASSTCELICGIIEMEKVTKEIAEALYTGIVDDTGVFQYSSTTSKTMRTAGELMDKGIDFSKIIEQTFFEKTYNQNRVMAHALLTAKLHDKGQIISSYVTAEDMKRFDVMPKHMDGIAEQLRNTKDVDVSVFLYETEDGSFKASTRASSDTVNLATLAKTYGGGGHAKAAGFSLKGDPDELIEGIVSDIRKFYE